MPVFSQDQLEAIQDAVATALAAQQQQQAPPVVPQADLAAAAAAVTAAAPQVAAVDINAIAHTIPSFWPEDVDGFFSTFEAPCVNKKITQDGTKYRGHKDRIKSTATVQILTCIL